jgi:hypothetical protein
LKIEIHVCWSEVHIACHSRRQLIGDADANHEGAGESEVGQVPSHFIGDLESMEMLGEIKKIK